MSHEATAWAIKQRGISPGAKLVLINLCDRYHPEHGCAPTQAVLVQDCEMSRSALNVHLAELEAARVISRDTGRDAENRQRPTRYRFAFEADFRPARSGAKS